MMSKEEIIILDNKTFVLDNEILIRSEKCINMSEKNSHLQKHIFLRTRIRFNAREFIEV